MSRYLYLPASAGRFAPGATGIQTALCMRNNDTSTEGDKVTVLCTVLSSTCPGLPVWLDILIKKGRLPDLQPPYPSNLPSSCRLREVLCIRSTVFSPGYFFATNAAQEPTRSLRSDVFRSSENLGELFVPQGT